MQLGQHFSANITVRATAAAAVWPGARASAAAVGSGAVRGARAGHDLGEGGGGGGGIKCYQRSSVQI